MLTASTLNGGLGVNAACELVRFVHIQAVVSLEFIFADLERFLRSLELVRCQRSKVLFLLEFIEKFVLARLALNWGQISTNSIISCLQSLSITILIVDLRLASILETVSISRYFECSLVFMIVDVELAR